MHARLRLQPAIGIGALDQDRRRFDARLFARMLADDLDLVVAPLRPAHIHALQHLRPVLALGAAGAGVDLHIGVVGVGLAGEQRFHLALVRFGPELLQRRLGFRDDALVALLLTERDELNIVVKLECDPAEARERGFELLPLAHEALRPRRVAPEIWRFELARRDRQGGSSPVQGQRCLLSRVKDCLMSLTMASVSERILSSVSEIAERFRQDQDPGGKLKKRQPLVESAGARCQSPVVARGRKWTGRRWRRSGVLARNTWDPRLRGQPGRTPPRQAHLARHVG